MANRGIGLRVARHADRGAHLNAHRLCKILEPLFSDSFQRFKKRQTIFFAGERKAIKSRFCSGDRAVHIRGIAQSDRSNLFFRCRVQNRH